MYANALQLTQTVAPTSEPVTVAEAKAHLYIDTSDHDTYIGTLIEAARNYVEAYTGRALVERTYRLDLRLWESEVVLQKPPLLSVSSIKYYDVDNSQQTWASANYEVDISAGRILLAADKTIPSSYDRYDAWQVTSVHGYDDASVSPTSAQNAIPSALRHAMKLMIGDMFETREAGGVAIGAVAWQSDTVNRLLSPYRTRF